MTYIPHPTLESAKKYVQKHVREDVSVRYRFVDYPMPDGSKGGYRIELHGVKGKWHWVYRNLDFETYC